jgi:hypothetical protein
VDDRAFDRLTRVVANGASRRGVLRGLAGVLALVTLGSRTPAIAAQGWLRLSDPCYDDSQCAQTQMSQIVCADNGFDYDGPLNCCVYDYGICDQDEDCCGALVCIGKNCGASPLASQTGLPLGSQCYSADQCSGGGSAMNCADNGGFVPACCLVGGQPCSQPLDCCMPNNCVSGYCQ